MRASQGEAGGWGLGAGPPRLWDCAAGRGGEGPEPRAQSPEPRRGQVVLEYFILFAVVALLTLVGLTTFDDQIRNGLEDVFNQAVAGMQHR